MNFFTVGSWNRLTNFLFDVLIFRISYLENENLSSVTTLMVHFWYHSYVLPRG